MSRKWRRTFVSLALSIVVHLLLVAVYQKLINLQREESLRPTRYLPDLLLLVPQAFRATSTRIPTVSMEQDLASLQEVGRLAAAPAAATTPLTGVFEIGVRSVDFKPIEIDLDTVDLDQQQIEAVQRLRDLYGSYARVWLPDPDTTDQQSVLENRARAIVAAALEAMGGTEKLLKIHTMDVLVWIVASEHATSTGSINVSPYAYPVGLWRFDDAPRGRKDLEPFAIDLRQTPLPAYATRTPGRSRGLYYQLYEARWLQSSPPPTRKFRERSEGIYWHIAHRFLDEGVRLAYLGLSNHTDRRAQLGLSSFTGRQVHRIRVEDSKFGRTYEAFFDVKTALLVSIREELLDLERQWYRQQRRGLRARPPVWITTFDRYEEIEGVLLPHRMHRTDGRSSVGSSGSTILLNIGLNGEQPDLIVPEL